MIGKPWTLVKALGRDNRLIINDSRVNIAQIQIQTQVYKETLYISDLR